MNEPIGCQAEPPASSGAMAPIPRRAWLVLAVCSSTVVLTLLDSGMMFVAFPVIEERFADQASRTTLSWIVTTFFVVMVSTLLVAGRIADRYGRRRVFLWGLVAYGIGAMVAASTSAVAVVISARALQGLGVAMLSPSALALALPGFPVQRRAYALGVWGTIGAVVGLTANPLGAIVVEALGWRGMFVVNGAIALALAALGAWVLEDQPTDAGAGPIDGVGAVASMVSVAGLALALVQGSDWGWASTSTLVATASCVAASCVFAWRTRSLDQPLINPAIFANRRFAVASIASVCAQLGYFSTWFGVPLYLGEVWGYSPLRIGFALLPLNVVPILIAVPVGRLVDRRGPRGVLAFGGGMAAIWYVAIGLWLTDAGYVWLAIGMVLSSVGALAIGNTTTVAALYDVDDNDLGSANAAYFVTRRLGSALGAVAVAAIIGNRAGDAFDDVFVWVWMFGAAVYLIGGLASWLFYPQTEPAAVR